MRLAAGHWPPCLGRDAENSGTIGQLMLEAGVTAEPQPNFWRKLETHDDYGWE